MSFFISRRALPRATLLIVVGCWLTTACGGGDDSDVSLNATALGTKIEATASAQTLIEASSVSAPLAPEPQADLSPFSGDPVIYAGPITIRKGGVYSGVWESTDARVAAITIETREPVTIEGCLIRSRGNMIEIPEPGAKVIVRGCGALGLNPRASNNFAGRFIKAYRPESLTVQNNSLVSTSGIYVNGDNEPGSTIVIRYNDVKNIDGRISDGLNGYTGDFYRVQFAQLDKVRSCVNCTISSNRVLNEPGNSRVEDNISIYLSGGTTLSPLEIKGNLITGAYPERPEFDGFSGGGIIVDGDAASASSASSHIRIVENTVISTSNYGIALAAGFEVDVTGNRILSSGKLPSGQRVASSNVGSYVWDIYENAGRGTFHTHRVSGNTIGWIDASANRNDVWFPSCFEPLCARQLAFEGAITSALENIETQNWMDRLLASGKQVGP